MFIAFRAQLSENDNYMREACLVYRYLKVHGSFSALPYLVYEHVLK